MFIWISGDIQELYETTLKPGHAAAFSDDCDSASAKGIIRGAGNQVGISSMSLLFSVKKEYHNVGCFLVSLVARD